MSVKMTKRNRDKNRKNVVNCIYKIQLAEHRQIVQREGTLSYLSSGFSFSEAAVVEAGWLSPEAPVLEQEAPAVGAL